MIGHDSFPALFFFILRSWVALGLGDLDFGLRCLGFLLGLLVVASLWLNARAFGLAMPFLSLALLALNAPLLRWGDSLRAYGLGCFFTVLVIGAVWSVVESPSPGRFMLACLAGILSVQSLYQNAFLLLAICVAGFLVCACRRRLKAGLAVLAIGAPAAISLLPYLRPIRLAQEWYVVEKTGFDPNLGLSNLLEALGSPYSWFVWIWAALGILAVWAGVGSLRNIRKSDRPGAEGLCLFSSLTLVLGLAFFVLFLWAAKLRTQPWYWLPVLCLGAVCLDGALSQWLGARPVWRLLCLSLLLCIPLTVAVGQAKMRQTNIDLIAARLSQDSRPGDLVVVYPWYIGVSFYRYYRGPAPWTTIPEISDLSLHRYDLIKARLADHAPIAPVLQRLGQTLRSGSRVWIVGALPGPEPGETRVPDLPPAPGTQFGWYDEPYNYVWGRQTQHFIALHATHAAIVPVISKDPVSPFEEIPLLVAW